MGEEAKKGSNKKVALIATVVVLVLALVAYGVSTLTSKSGQKNKAPKITLLTPAQPPPPPPPPPKFEKKPEPPKEQKEMKVDQPAEKKVEQQASPELKMDGPAGNGPSSFAAGNITSEDLSKVGSGKGGAEKTGMFNPFNNYASAAKGELQRFLGKNNALKRRRYSVDVHVWVDGAGLLKRFELIGSSNDSDTDEAIRAALAALPGFSQAPPQGMPQPIRLRIVTSN